MKKSLSILVLFLSLGFANAALAKDKFKFSFKEKDILKVLSEYSDKTGTQFVVSPSVRGRISILFPEDVSQEEAFNALSTSLSMNGFAIVKEGKSLTVIPARQAQRSNLEIYENLPPLQPERLVTFIYKFKKRNPDEVYKNLRILSSKDGETSVDNKSKSLIITDWASNINRIHNLLSKIDI